MMIDELIKNLHYCPDSGELWWSVPAPKRSMDKPAGSKNGRGYIHIQFNGKKYKAHRIVFYMHHGHLPKEIDHIDGDPANNRIANLRAASRSGNMRNTTLSKRNTSGAKGVSWNPQHKKWQSRLRAGGSEKHIGYYTDFFEACCAIHSARNRYHGEYANHG